MAELQGLLERVGRERDEVMTINTELQYNITEARQDRDAAVRRCVLSSFDVAEPLMCPEESAVHFLFLLLFPFIEDLSACRLEQDKALQAEQHHRNAQRDLYDS